MTFQEFKNHVIAACENAGITEYELYYQAGSSVSVDTFQHSINEFTSSRSGGVCFRCIVNGKMGYASTEALNEEQAKALVTKAADSASVLEAEEQVFLGEGGQEYEPLDIKPYDLPTTEELRNLDFALASLAIKTGVTRHAGTLEKVYTPLGEAYAQTGKDLSRVDKVVITGGSLIHVDTVDKIAAHALYDLAEPASLKPQRFEVLVDKQYILSAMGLLSQYEPDIALNIMKKELKSYGIAE